mmetsp:Transcript_23657/g.67922  ORF Transcript_23657/g.67922 Transcript_23657/m.67922 type:complete len:332 (+) Transcript_23657:69-1064(+)
MARLRSHTSLLLVLGAWALCGAVRQGSLKDATRPRFVEGWATGGRGRHLLALLLATGGAHLGPQDAAAQAVDVLPEWRKAEEWKRLLPDAQELAGFSRVPSDAPIMDKGEYLELFGDDSTIMSMFPQGWPFDWIWSPVLYAEMWQASGIYALVAVVNWAPVWRRVGTGQAAFMGFAYDTKRENWRWQHSMEAEVPGRVYYGLPDFATQLVVKHRDVASASEQRYEGMFLLQQGKHVEGMPVYRSAAAVEQAWWIFSHDGAWVFAKALAGYSFDYLLDLGFFTGEQGLQVSWLYRSKPHKGLGFEDHAWTSSEKERGTISVFAPDLWRDKAN